MVILSMFRPPHQGPYLFLLVFPSTLRVKNTLNYFHYDRCYCLLIYCSTTHQQVNAIECCYHFCTFTSSINLFSLNRAMFTTITLRYFVCVPLISIERIKLFYSCFSFYFYIQVNGALLKCLLSF